MKKAVKWLALFVMTVCLGAALAACGGKVAGVYECEMEMGGVKSVISLELQEDETFTLKTKAEVGGVSNEQEIGKGTYKVDGDKITLTLEAEGETTTLEGTVKDGDIVVSQGGASITYKKK